MQMGRREVLRQREGDREADFQTQARGGKWRESSPARSQRGRQEQREEDSRMQTIQDREHRKSQTWRMSQACHARKINREGFRERWGREWDVQNKLSAAPTGPLGPTRAASLTTSLSQPPSR